MWYWTTEGICQFSASVLSVKTFSDRSPGSITGVHQRAVDPATLRTDRGPAGIPVVIFCSVIKSPLRKVSAFQWNKRGGYDVTKLPAVCQVVAVL